jgi:UDP-glucose 4-epimerase
MVSCLVTGGCGFIGSHLVERLVEEGHRVRVLDDLSTGRRENLRAVWKAIEFQRGSVTDAESARKALQGIDWVFHLAALPSVQRSLEDPLSSHEVCATGTLMLLEGACRAGVTRLVYAASSSAYGDCPGVVREESMPCRPLSPYAAAKLAGEHYCDCYSRLFDLETVRLRFFNVFGPRQEPHSCYGGVIARFIAALLQGQSPTIQGDGEQSRDFTYVSDVVQTLLLAAKAPGASGKVYNIGRGERTIVLDLLKILNHLLGKDVRPIFTESRPGDVRHSQADITRARIDLGYEPEVSLSEGLRLTLEDQRRANNAWT